MSRLENAAQLAELRTEAKKKKDGYEARVLLCMTGCRARGAVELGKKFREELEGQNQYAIVDVGCHGQCSRAPLILIEPQGILYGNVKPEDVPEIVEKTLKNVTGIHL